MSTAGGAPALNANLNFFEKVFKLNFFKNIFEKVDGRYLSSPAP